mgnify:FL=1
MKAQNPGFSKIQIEAAQSRNPFAQLSDIVYSVLEDAIIHFELFPGSKLSVVQIADELGVSRTPVTYALERLAEEGLVTKKEGKRGYFVWDISLMSLEKNFMARRALEGTAAYICAQRGTFRKDTRLKTLAEQFDSAIRERSFEDFAKIDTSFHWMIIRASENPYIIKAYQQMERFINYYSIRSQIILIGQKENSALETLANQHLAIYNAIMTGIPELAENSAKTHLETCYNLSMRFHTPVMSKEK